MIIKAVYEDNVLKPLEKLDLKEGEEVEIEIKKRRDILKYAGILKDLSEEEEKIFQEAVKRRNLFGGALKL
ncbi:hypothetical protein FHEFKHOI_01321 [Candidatus Methanoperedenaceae archaeon GB50]|nr:hypothetical protein AIOGIFDO_01313 [Candidatus Methanoperedenaceae archaeon GB37]CAD7773002.1 hypothetical protein FHEFKHOI_01321 [Candidatus Methanoperedenaceae archaeon GB50]CAD7780885.1 MAG: hypothetical protein KBONHNOK_01544 [Candidatus Methanoperedenaceae archaeon GB50]